jgi:2-iminoacetate synthase
VTHPVRNIREILSLKGLDRDRSAWLERIEAITDDQVQAALSMSPWSYKPEKLVALVSPAAEKYIEQMAQTARRLTIQRFGRTVKLYAPLYVSNHCVNGCTYCGFNCKSKTKRARLTVEEAVAEAEVIAGEGFRDLLLVSSEDREYIDVEYLCELASRLQGKFSSLSVEIYQMSEGGYSRLFEAGIDGVTLYQETYDRDVYQAFHRSGPKADYDERLLTPGRAARAGMREVGLGALLGLTNWRLETLALAEHGHHLMKSHWQSHISFSFPRLRPASDVDAMQFEHLLSDTELVQMILALRLCFADAGLVISTRESADLRDHLIELGITKMSAGSKTSPGGYLHESGQLKQFEIDDSRRPAEVAEMIKSHGFEPVWKDWERPVSAQKHLTRKRSLRAV